MGLPDAEELEKEFEREKRRADEGGQVRERKHFQDFSVHHHLCTFFNYKQDTIMLSNIDSRGRLQDIGAPSTQPVSHGPRKREKFKVCVVQYLSPY